MVTRYCRRVVEHNSTPSVQQRGALAAALWRGPGVAGGTEVQQDRNKSDGVGGCGVHTLWQSRWGRRHGHPAGAPLAARVRCGSGPAPARTAAQHAEHGGQARG